MALRLVAVVALAFGALAAGASAAPPPGATAQCRDGSYSFAVHHSGACSHHGGVAVWLDAAAPGAAPASPLLGRTVLLRPRTRTAGCVLAAEPDRRCSPGAYSANLTVPVLCAGRFHTSTIRRVTDGMRHAVEIAYGLAPRAYGRTLEIDHVVPLELGGSNDLANLFPERAPGYHAKDRLENALHARVCSGALSLRTAQAGIASNWEGLYREVFGTVP